MFEIIKIIWILLCMFGRQVRRVIVGENRYYLNRFPLNIPTVKRHEHTHILAGSGHGKTQVLLQLIYKDILALKKGYGGFCVIDSQGDLIKTIRWLKELSPMVKNSLSKRVVIVDPEDVENPVALNMFDVKLERLNQIRDPATRETVMTATLSLFEYVFSDLIEGGLTLYQKNIYNFSAQLLMRIPGANIKTFLDLLRDGERFRHDFNKLEDGLAKQFFENEFFSKKYQSTKEQIATRLWSILSHSTFQRILCSQSNKIDIYDLMNNGHIVLINTSKALLQEDRCRMLGRFFIALVLQATYQRAAIPENKRRNFTLYIDEVQDYLSDTLADFLSQARKFHISLVFAHQYLAQLDNVSKNLKASVLANTSIKLFGRVENADADFLSRRIGVDSKEFLNLKKDKKFTEYLCYVRDFTSKAKKIKFPLGFVNKKQKMTQFEQDELIKINNIKYCEDFENRNIGNLNIESHIGAFPEHPSF